MQCLYLRLRRNNPMTKKDVVIATQKPDIPGYSGFYPRINGYIVNCIWKNTKVARDLIFLDALTSDPEKVWNVVVS